MVKSEMITAVGGMDENLFLYAEEYDFQVRCRKGGWTISYVPSARVIHEKSVSADAFFGHRRLAAVVRSHYYVSAKHGGTRRLWIIVPLWIFRSLLRLTIGTVLNIRKPEIAKRHLLEQLEVIRMSLSKSTFLWIRSCLRN
jgi:GT2 family glycosyltransferase